MRRTAIFLIVVFAAVWLHADGDDLNCFTIVVGKGASADGSLLMAHNEDDYGRLLVNVYKVPAQEHGKGDTVAVAQGGLSLPQVKNTAAMLWLEIPESEVADSFVNEHGVTVASDSCPSREDRPELVKNGIGYMLRRLIAERAQTAREGVRIAGELLSQFGYSSSGRTYIIADAREGWLLHIVMGKHWVAQRVPDHEVAVIANCYTIGSVDLSDSKNFMGSPDLVDYAVQRGWYDPQKDGGFDFARAYANPASLADMRNILRQWQGINLLAAKSPKLEERLPFSFKPRRAVRLVDLFRVLRDHYEGTEYDLSDHYKNGSPNSGRQRTICTESTQYAFVAQLRDWLPTEIAHVLWLSLRRPDSNAFSPWCVAAGTCPDGYGLGNAADAWKNHFSPLPAQALDDPGLAFNTFARLSEMVDRQYRVRIEKTQKLWRNHEDFLFRDVKDHEAEFAYLLRTNKPVAQKIIATYFHGLEYRRWFLALELLREFR